MNIENIKKLKFLKFLENKIAKIILYDKGISEEGEPIESFNIDKNVIFRTKPRRVIDSENKNILLNGFVLCEGDINEELEFISDGKIVIDNIEYTIFSGYRVYNPDGSVNHCKWEIM